LKSCWANRASWRSTNGVVPCRAIDWAHFRIKAILTSRAPGANVSRNIVAVLAFIHPVISVIFAFPSKWASMAFYLAICTIISCCASYFLSFIRAFVASGAYEAHCIPSRGIIPIFTFYWRGSWVSTLKSLRAVKAFSKWI
jgi:hypothetical protein